MDYVRMPRFSFSRQKLKMWTDVRIKDKLEEIYKRVLDIAVAKEKTIIHISPISGGVMSGNEFTVDLGILKKLVEDNYKLFILKVTLDVLKGLLEELKDNDIHIKICIYSIEEYNWLKQT